MKPCTPSCHEDENHSSLQPEVLDDPDPQREPGDGTGLHADDSLLPEHLALRPRPPAPVQPRHGPHHRVLAPVLAGDPLSRVPDLADNQVLSPLAHPPPGLLDMPGRTPLSPGGKQGKGNLPSTADIQVSVKGKLVVTLFSCHLAVITVISIILAVWINKSLVGQFSRQGECAECPD